MDIVFEHLDPARAERWLPEMFGILYANMSRIAPTGEAEAGDRRAWLSYLRPALRAGTRVLLMRADGALAGYFQYSVRGDVLLIEEVEITPRWQCTSLFARLLQTVAAMPGEIRAAEAYVDKRNARSMNIAHRLGFRVVGENPNGRSWRLRADWQALRARLAPAARGTCASSEARAKERRASGEESKGES